MKSWEREYGGVEENKGEEKEKREGEGERRSGGENDRSRGGEEGAVLGERRGRESEGGASFLTMQVLEIPARGRGFPLVILIILKFVVGLFQTLGINQRQILE